MKVIGLTGGIGSGKTTVARMFEELGVPVYIADTEAKALTNRSKIIKRKLTQLLGPRTYKDGKLDRKYVANIVFSNPEILQQVNAIIHPKVASHFKRWLSRQDAPYAIKEAAILFENGGYKQCDKTILVIAPKNIRIQRIISRDGSTTEEVEARMANQWPDSDKAELADFIIENIDLEVTKNEVIRIHKTLAKPQ